MAATPSPATPTSFGAGEVRCLCRQAGCQRKPPMDQNHRRTGRWEWAAPSFRPPMAATPSPASTFSFGAGGSRCLCRQAGCQMETSNGPKPSAEKGEDLGTPSFRPPMAATPSPASPTPSATGRWYMPDVYVVKLDANGNLQWTKTIGGPKSENLRANHPSFRPPMAATPSPDPPPPSAQEVWMSMSSSWTRMAMPAAPSARPPK
jgi:hypothetical protein